MYKKVFRLESRCFNKLTIKSNVRRFTVYVPPDALLDKNKRKQLEANRLINKYLKKKKPISSTIPLKQECKGNADESMLFDISIKGLPIEYNNTKDREIINEEDHADVENNVNSFTKLKGKNQKKIAFQNQRLRLFEKEHLCITGANGSGKTLLTRIIAFYMDDDSASLSSPSSPPKFLLNGNLFHSEKSEKEQSLDDANRFSDGKQKGFTKLDIFANIGDGSIPNDNTRSWGAKAALEGNFKRPQCFVLNLEQHKDFLSMYGDEIVSNIFGGIHGTDITAELKEESISPKIDKSNLPASLSRNLIVQMGLYPFWYKKVKYLSTGEIRKVLLAWAVSKIPRCLILENPYDGLDTKSRSHLRSVLSQLCRGFPRLLVDIGSTTKIPQINLILSTLREKEETPDEIHQFLEVKDLKLSQATNFDVAYKVAHPIKKTSHTSSCRPSLNLFPKHYSRPMVDINEVKRQVKYKWDKDNNGIEPLVFLNDVTITKKKIERGITTAIDLLKNVNLKIGRNESWHIAGRNGAGKSTLVKLIEAVALMSQKIAKQKPNVNGSDKSDDNSILNTEDVPVSNRLQSLLSYSEEYSQNREEIIQNKSSGKITLASPFVGIVSTDLHLYFVSNHARERVDHILLSALLMGSGIVGSAHSNFAESAENLFLDAPSYMYTDLEEYTVMLGISNLLFRSFGSLSHGEQKLVLFCRALLAKPTVFIMDEIGQGLDTINRGKVTSILNEIVDSPMFSSKALIHITHHEDEELKNYSHKITLKNGQLLK